jgi:hypothetical protein
MVLSHTVLDGHKLFPGLLVKMHQLLAIRTQIVIVDDVLSQGSDEGALLDLVRGDSTGEGEDGFKPGERDGGEGGG